MGVGVGRCSRKSCKRGPHFKPSLTSHQDHSPLPSGTAESLKLSCIRADGRQLTDRTTQEGGLKQCDETMGQNEAVVDVFPKNTIECILKTFLCCFMQLLY